MTTRTIRFYEDVGLLSPARSGGQRIFDGRDRTRLRLILRGKRVGFALAEIAEIVDMYDSDPGERGQLELLLGRIDVHRADLLARRQAVDETLKELEQVASAAGVRLAQLTD